MKANSGTFARLYQLPEIRNEEILGFLKSKDVENSLLIHLIETAKKLMNEELIPLFSYWIAHYKTENYLFALDQVLRDTPEGQFLAENKDFMSYLKYYLFFTLFRLNNHSSYSYFSF